MRKEILKQNIRIPLYYSENINKIESKECFLVKIEIVTRHEWIIDCEQYFTGMVRIPEKGHWGQDCYRIYYVEIDGKVKDFSQEDFNLHFIYLHKKIMPNIVENKLREILYNSANKQFGEKNIKEILPVYEYPYPLERKN